MFYNRSWQGIGTKQFIPILNDYLIWYREKRIKLSLHGLSPIEYRRKLGLIWQPPVQDYVRRAIPSDFFVNKTGSFVVKLIAFHKPMNDGGNYYTSAARGIEFDYQVVDENTIKIIILKN